MTMREDEERLTTKLRELAGADLSIQPPARIEQAMLAQWEALSARPLRQRPNDQARERVIEAKRHVRWVVPVWVAVAALMIAAVALKYRAPAPSPALTETRATTSHDMLPRALPVSDMRAALSRQGTARSRQRSRGPAPSRRPPSGLGEPRDATNVTMFVPLLPVTEEDQYGALQVVRVRLPRSALVGFGVPVDENQMTEPLQADVLLGEDGLARGIRFIRN